MFSLFLQEVWITAEQRIKAKTSEVRDQCYHCAQGIAGEPNWPSTAPPEADVKDAADDLPLLPRRWSLYGRTLNLSYRTR